MFKSASTKSVRQVLKKSPPTSSLTIPSSSSFVVRNHYVSINPTTGKESEKKFTSLSNEQLEETIQASWKSFEAWNPQLYGVNPKELSDLIRWRCESVMNPLAELFDSKKNELAKLMALDMGKPLAQGIAEAEKCVLLIRYYAKNAESIMRDRIVTENEKHISKVVYQPLGPILQCAPFNFPYWQVIRFCIPAMLAGNTVLIRHNHQVPQCAESINHLFAEALDKGNAPKELRKIYQNVFLENEQVSTAIAHPKVRGVAFTGSTQVGKIIATQAAANLKKHVLELGGADAFIVLKDADLELAVKNAVTSRINNCGQTCIAAKRFIVEKDVLPQFEKMLVERVNKLVVGNPLENGVEVGPMARKDLRDKLDEQVQLCKQQGAKVLTGGFKLKDKEGWFYAPTVLSGVTPDNFAFQNELFGPVFVVIAAENADHAVSLANDSIYGLGGSVYSRDWKKGMKYAEKLECGLAFVNGIVRSSPDLPFGGVKESGYGRECGPEGMLEWCNVKTMSIEK
ncbi:hypothetical protein FDP41_003617 [Naegleria fowleri]|uniref:Aldehyde dehydrogenase domain-containing protein n=1 Tax=Naegleria fowleri TaxID=5763 RepID=A0A6A5BWE0_NAEFO|nr:uncharacterized protein FDP41_003617 [Naegleria fowleri]KAF0977625.1 hypothetical protein FDP41_003617 [Naegleria fowleri]